ncbi:GNAT family N-acetyltransferase [Tenuibacillus multivorans]|uniref:Acetyltransferase (GNAT) family protein n=1 Tax=Tenuibacillus multivorans TaxID=237069 RepID=A0A1G9WG29_9BACI|nr:GNAT family N-acetyltransferase [Tenuibacillus multivorans]GEL76448.1 hypothetical protein TMU01_06830 [Tenuibacillus multivorans]SDM83430.1 Acetyltransferase (GNAT) family protein [Tenuibacillus multivorans]
MNFLPIDLTKHKAKAIAFRRDSFIVSFGTDDGFGDPDGYIQWLAQNQEKFPDGFVMVEEDEVLIGQLELSIREYKGEEIGYVHLFYLVPEKRGQGIGIKLDEYARKFFGKHQVAEFHLRVAPSNDQALSFYKKLGMKVIGPEFDGKVIRMKGKV